LLGAGLSVTFYADGWARTRAERAGCDFVEAPTGGAATAFYEATSTEDVTRIYDQLDRRLAPDLLGLLQQEGIAAVVTDSTSLGAALAAERSGLPWASLSTTPAEFTPQVRQAGAQYVASAAPLRAALGLPPSDAPTAEQIISPHLLLCTWSDGFDAELVPAQAHHLGPLFLSTPGGAADALAALPRDRPVVLLSTSSVAVAALEGCAEYIRDAAASVLESMDVVALVSASGTAPVAEAGRNLVSLPFVPHAQLLPRVDVMVSHGGWGSVGRALAHGIPLVLTPLALDQPWVAELCEARGVGISLDYDQLDEDALQQALERVLAPDSGYRRRAAAVQAELAEAMARGDAPGRLRELLVAHGP
jgi:UDP:flavonoid glycosyltransferase YjiC (YdhE family)